MFSCWITIFLKRTKQFFSYNYITTISFQLQSQITSSAEIYANTAHGDSPSLVENRIKNNHGKASVT